MGYTHYWKLKSEIPQRVWDRFAADVNKALAQLPEHSSSSGGCYSDQPLKLVFESDVLNWGPAINADRVRFNGAGDMGHETFLLENRAGPEFCKTARKPYDLAVQIVLLLAERRFGSRFSIGSDGGYDDWQQAEEIVALQLGKAWKGSKFLESLKTEKEQEEQT